VKTDSVSHDCPTTPSLHETSRPAPTSAVSLNEAAHLQAQDKPGESAQRARRADSCQPLQLLLVSQPPPAARSIRPTRRRRPKRNRRCRRRQPCLRGAEGWHAGPAACCRNASARNKYRMTGGPAPGLVRTTTRPAGRAGADDTRDAECNAAASQGPRQQPPGFNCPRTIQHVCPPTITQADTSRRLLDPKTQH